MASQPPMVVAGAGSWGTALAMLLARNGYSVLLWGRDPAQIEEMRRRRENSRYLPGIPLPELIQPVSDLAAAAAPAQDVLVAVPSSAFRQTLRGIAAHLSPAARLMWATKGLENNTRQLLHRVAAEELGEQRPMAVISGPTFAAEVAAGLPAAVTVAAQPSEYAAEAAAMLRNASFRVYTSSDMTGVEISAASKNVIAIAAGIADGLGFGANTRAALVTRGLAEIMRLGVALGGRHETFMGLAGLGDLMLTCTDNQSRNRRFGYALAQGSSVEQARAHIGQVVEGALAAPEVLGLAQSLKIEMPITEQVYRVVSGQCTPREAVHSLLNREPKAEAA
jgi:glycerol-3-phosphate dehydrogenase (NAD(P)+)